MEHILVCDPCWRWLKHGPRCVFLLHIAALLPPLATTAPLRVTSVAFVMLQRSHLLHLHSIYGIT